MAYCSRWTGKAWVEGILAKIFGKPSKFAKPGETNPILPKEDVAIIGDIHGRLDLLKSLISRLQSEVPNTELVFVGDYIDRGPSSREVLEYLQRLDSSVVCLKGNHEAMLLDFIDNPIQHGRQWLRNGGSETLASFGITVDENSSANSIQNANGELKSRLSNGTETWLRALPLFWHTGNLVVTHAGPDPKKSIQDQDEESFLWGHHRFLRDARTDGIWVAHGHWIQDRPTCRNGRISVDTGAYFSGRLTAAIVTHDGSVKFLNS